MDNQNKIVIVHILTAHDTVYRMYYEVKVDVEFFLELFEMFDGGIV